MAKMTYRERLLDAATLLAALSAVAVAATVVLGRTPEVRRSAEKDRPLENWKEYAAEGHRVGPEEPDHLIVLFQDYECPGCASFHRSLESVKRSRSDLAVVYRHWPLERHLLAYEAARAAECAGLQGAFVPYNDALYFKPDKLGNWLDLAELAQVPNKAEFARCVGEVGGVASIDRDIAAAKQIGYRGTPTIVINGVLLSSIPDSASLVRTLDSTKRRRIRGG